MSAIVALPSLEPGTEAWLDQRQRKIGGSEIAAVLGLSKWHSRFSLWHQKAHRMNTHVDDNAQTEWGHRLEAVVAEKYADTHPDLCLGPTITVTRTDRPYQIAAPDRIVGDREALLEVKTQRDQEGWGEPGTDQVPIYYRCQALWYLDVLEVDRCDFAVLIGGSDYREYTVTYDEAEALVLRTAAEEFIATIDAGQRPPIDEHSATYLTIRELHPDIDPTDVELSAELAREFCNAKHAEKAAADEARRVTSVLADYLGTAQRATFLGATIARRQAKQGGTPYLVAGRNLPTFTESETAA